MKRARKQKRPAHHRHWEPTMRSIQFGFTVCVFVILVINVAVLTGLELLLAHYGFLDGIDSPYKAMPVVLCAVASLPIGMLVSFVAIRLPMRPVKRLLAAMARLADGHFEERLDLSEVEPFREMSDTFNALASELQNTQMLRSDFVNNFSHEFKTPIVSINGFATLLQKGELTEDEKKEYIDIIAEETGRLASMATNVLNLTRVENQAILTNLKEFNLSEQLRRCILILEKKWTAKALTIEAGFQEFIVRGDPDLLKQVWVNLLDNAVKFSPAGGEVAVEISRKAGGITVSIANHGPVIPPGDQKRLFDKFWQGDTSHASEGAGVGLSVVRKIVALHKGDVEVLSTPEQTRFTVRLPA